MTNLEIKTLNASTILKTTDGKPEALKTALESLISSALNSGRCEEVTRKEKQIFLQEKKAQEENNKLLAEIPERFLNSSFENFNAPFIDKDAVEKLKSYAKRLDAKKYSNVKDFETAIIVGRNGNGKTHLGISILKVLEYNGLYIESDTMCKRLIRSRAFKALKDEESLIKEIASKPFLVIDEIGRARDKETEQHALFDIINIRYHKKLDTCLISNQTKEELQDYLGLAVMDRISENYFFAELKASSYRRKSPEERHREAITN